MARWARWARRTRWARWDRFDIVEAYYLYTQYYHSGQGSKFYATLSHMAGNRFRMRDLNYSKLTENGKDIYASLVERDGENIRDRR